VGWALFLAFVIIVFIPISIIMTGAAVAAILGWSLKETGEEDANPELIELS
jgi:hypothetical protein